MTLLGRWVALVALGGTLVASCDNAGSACSTSGDCSSNNACVYRISDGCLAKATCEPKPTGPICTFLEQYCGCQGEIVEVRCSDPYGYAPAPVSGQMSGACPAADGGQD